MNRYAQTICTGLLLIVCSLSGCRTPVLVDYDHEAAAKFEAYKCFFVSTSDIQENNDSLVLSPIVNRRFERAIKTALIEREYVEDCPAADFFVQFHITKKTINVMEFRNAARYSHFNFHRGYPDVGFFPPPYIDSFEEGSFVLDLIDAQSKELVWRGKYVERLNRRPHEEEEIRTIIHRILDRFPPDKVSDTGVSKKI